MRGITFNKTTLSDCTFLLCLVLWLVSRFDFSRFIWSQRRAVQHLLSEPHPDSFDSTSIFVSRAVVVFSSLLFQFVAVCPKYESSDTERCAAQTDVVEQIWSRLISQAFCRRLFAVHTSVRAMSPQRFSGQRTQHFGTNFCSGGF